MEKASLKFITAIRYHRDILRSLNSMTYIFDENWNPDNSTKATFPVAFFHVKSCHEVMSSEISQKQMLFYNSASAETKSDPLASGGLLNVVADNIVIKPKIYKLDVVIPFHNLTLLDQSFVYNTHTNLAITEALLGQANEATQYIGAYSTLSAPYADFIKGLLRMLINQNYSSFDLNDWISSTTQQPDFNKQSLEMMWRLRRIVKMKMWNSWDYKYVAIVDMDITKEGTEDGVYEATMTLQELPIVCMYNKDKANGSPSVMKNDFLKMQGNLAIKALNVAGGEQSLSSLGVQK
jgi:hypothetical protein